jgi:uncharacterized protein (DUF736 family)
MKTLREQGVDLVIESLQENNTNFLDNPYRLGSTMYFEVIKEVKRLVAEDRYRLTEVDKMTIETDIGQFEIFEGELVPLDCPMEETEPSIFEKLNLKGLTFEEKDEKEKELNKPKRGGAKKFYVYVKDPSSGNVKKVSFGAKDGGSNLSVKLDDPEARKSFAARHNCSSQTDKTSAAYWSCRLPRYAKQLGLSGGGSFFW